MFRLCAQLSRFDQTKKCRPRDVTKHLRREAVAGRTCIQFRFVQLLSFAWASRRGLVECPIGSTTIKNFRLGLRQGTNRDRVSCADDHFATAKCPRRRGSPIARTRVAHHQGRRRTNGSAQPSNRWESVMGGVALHSAHNTPELTGRRPATRDLSFRVNRRSG